MGYYYNGSNTIYCYDDNDGTPGHTGGGGSPYPHTLEEGLNSAAWSPYLTNPGVLYFLATKNVSNGHPTAGNANATTLKMDLGQLLIISGGALTSGVASNAAGIYWQLGKRVGSGESLAGTHGPHVYATGTSILRGNFAIYGSDFRGLGIQFLPDDVDLFVNEICGNSFDASALIILGLNPTQSINELRNNRFSSRGAVGMCSNVNVRQSSGNLFIQSGTTYTSFFPMAGSGRRLVYPILSGEVSSGTDYAHFSNTGVQQQWFMVGPTWPNEQRKYRFGHNSLQLTNNLQSRHYEKLDVLVVESAGVPLSGIPVWFTDALGSKQVDVLTDGMGGIAFGSDYVVGATLAGNHVIVEEFGNWEFADLSDYSRRYRGPFLLEVNAGPDANPNYASRRILFDWPYTGTSRKLGQYHPVRIVVNLDVPEVQGPGEYARSMVPSTPFSPVSGPSTPFVPSDVPVTPFVRGVVPDSGYLPCQPGVGPAGFSHVLGSSVPFARSSVPAVQYIECGADFPGKFIILGPWMPMRLSGS